MLTWPARLGRFAALTATINIDAEVRTNVLQIFLARALSRESGLCIRVHTEGI